MVLASGNATKLREIREILGPLPVKVVSLGELAPLAEPVEDGPTFAPSRHAGGEEERQEAEEAQRYHFRPG